MDLEIDGAELFSCTVLGVSPKALDCHSYWLSSNAVAFYVMGASELQLIYPILPWGWFHGCIYYQDL
jgi:hypothetical protein